MIRFVTLHLVLYTWFFFNFRFLNGDNEPANDPLKKTEILKEVLKDSSSNSLSKIQNIKYIGAVLEFEPYDKWTEEEKGYGIMRENAKTIVAYAKQAKKLKADIIIGPEYGIQSTIMHKDNIEQFLTFVQYVPDPSPNIVPCNFTDETIDRLEALQILSCGAKENKIYIVGDLAEMSPCSDTIEDYPWPYQPQGNCPEQGYFIYNTQVVFDRTGAVIARYRKQHLFLEDLFTSGPPNNTEAIFVTDFDVAFTLQICFDIIYETPAYSNVKDYGIRDVAMSTAWVDELPFYLENGFHNAWSRRLGVNLLVSGYHKPEVGHLGSGIFKGYSQDLPNYMYNENSGNVLLVSVVETVSASSLSLPIKGRAKKEPISSRSTLKNFNVALNESNLVSNGNRNHALSYQNLSIYTMVLLKNGPPDEIMNTTACSNGFCCNISYEYSGNQTYYFLAFSGTVPSGNGTYQLGSQICDLVWCPNPNFNSCARIESQPQETDSFGFVEISSNNFQSDSVYPVANHRNKSLVKNDELDFESGVNYSSISTKGPIENLLTLALNGRWYSKDSS